MHNFSSVFRLFREMKAFPGLLAFSLVCLLLVNMLALSRPLLTSWLLNQYLNASYEKIQQGCIIMTGLLMVESLLTYGMSYALSVLGQKIILSLRNRVYGHIMQMSSSWFDTTPVGTLITRSVSDIEAMNEVFTNGLLQIAGDMLLIILLIGAMIYKNFFLSLSVIAVLPFLLLASSFFRKGVQESFSRVREAVNRLNVFLQERLNGMIWIRLFGVQEREMQRFKELNKMHREANIKTIFYYSVFFPVMDILTSVSLALLMYLGFLQRSSSQVNVGDLAFFIMIAQMLFRPIRMLADRLNTLQMGLIASRRVYDLLDNSLQLEKEGGFVLKECPKQIRFENVSFSYVPGQQVLKNIRFTLRKGEKLGLVGKTGSGKSTLVQLLGGFTDAYEGTILIDDKELRTLEKESLRKKIFILPQDVFLFNDTLLENIRMYDAGITEKQVMEFVRELELDEFIGMFEGGLHYTLRERGSGLSAGQKQLIAFLRGRALNPDVFVFDEATSYLDVRTEHLLQTAMNKILKDKTAIIIAHRLSTIMQCDRLLVLENGIIIEEGTPEKLRSDEHSAFRTFLDQYLTEFTETP
jgi:ATP-binding cassette subfamily B protein